MFYRCLFKILFALIFLGMLAAVFTPLFRHASLEPRSPAYAWEFDYHDNRLDLVKIWPEPHEHKH